MNNQTTDAKMIAASQVSYRIALGLLGMALPFILLIGGLLCGLGVLTSISAYYYLDTSPGPLYPSMRDIFVGVLFVIGVALYFYEGYEKQKERLSDNLVANVAGISAIGVALSPMAQNPADEAFFHVAFAVVFFAAITWFCFFLFTRSGASDPDRPEKKRANRRYRRYGSVMLGALVSIAIISKYFPDLKTDSSAVFWLESIAVFTFGLAWWRKAATPVVELSVVRAITAALSKGAPAEEAVESYNLPTTEEEEAAPEELEAAPEEEEAATVEEDEEEELAAIPLPDLTEDLAPAPAPEPAEEAEEEAGEAGKPPDDRSP